MNKQNYRVSAVVAIVTILAVSTFSASIFAVNAADYQKTYAFIAASPNPAGLGQDVAFSFFLSNLQASAGGTGGARFHNLTVTVTKPDGTKTTLGPFTTDAVSTSFTMYRPDQLGNYTVVMNYPGEFTPATVGPGGSSPDTTFSASTSNILALSVQQNAIPELSGNPMPTGYWNRPINAQNFHWGGVSNNWLMAGWDTTSRQFDQGPVYVPVGDAPDSAHILWTKPLTFGGLMGGEFGNQQFTDGRSYEQFFKPPVIISGRLYYNTIQAEEPVTAINYSSITCVDLKDGSTVFVIPNATLSFGQIYNYVSPNQAGGLAYLWETRGSTWRMFDAWTGNYILSIAGVPSGTILMDNLFYGDTTKGPGDILVYSVNANARTLTLWNSSKCIPKLGDTGTNYWQWRPYTFVGQTLNATGITTYVNANGQTVQRNSSGIEWVASLDDFPTGGAIRQIGYDNTVWVSNGTQPIGVIFSFPYVSTWVSYNMFTGQKTSGPVTIDIRTQIPENATVYFTNSLQSARQITSDGIAPFWCKESMQYFAWNVKTGQFLWKSTPLSTNGFALYNWESKMLTPDGYLYNWGYDGSIHAYDVKTGNRLWDFSTGNAGTNSPYGVWPVYNGITIMDGKLFAQTSDHGNGVTPLYQGEGLYALDYKTGAQLWNITGWWEQPAIADGKYLTHNCYDNQIYTFGKGPSQVAVSASPTVQTRGSKIMIQGTVTDQSPGAKQKVSDGEFNSIPLIADEYQGQFMNYIYQQQQMPDHARGVPVKLTATDPNGNHQDIGTVLSDTSGMFKMMWTPPVEGEYTIVATFEGSNSYWPSYAQTAMGISAAPSASVPPTTTPTPTGTTNPTPIVTTTPTNAPSPNAQTPIALYVGIAAVVVIIAVVAAALVLRKRK